MTPERYRQIGELYHAALEIDAGERAAFLERACAGDEEMRRELDSLIASHEEAADFIAEPALAVVAGLFAEGEADALTGQTISHYKILSLIGAGGMGQVYLAEDTQLGRRVALKLLPEQFTSDTDRVRRFRQEARAASALNHPNIITIHEIGKAGDRHYIATEYIEGETLRERLDGGRLRQPDAFDVAAQMASALAAAHEAGIIHRDVKPENVMIRRDGYVKVLDFGLAKLTERPALDADAATVSMVKTDPGSVMGTVTYMSPEQVRGLKLDARTDVWSLGVVVYEMITGRRPFEGATPSDVIVSILEKQPATLTHNAPETPAELERIVTKALTKNTEERYQTAKEIAIDLKRLKQRQEVEAEMERFAAPGASSSDAAATAGGQMATASAKESTAAQTGQIRTATGPSSVEYLIGKIKRHQGRAALLGVVLVILIAGLGYSFYRFVVKNQFATKPAAPFQTTRITRLTSDGKASDAAISPDGKYVVYVIDDDGQQSLWVRQVATASDVQIIPHSKIEYLGLTFSPDGNYVYYVTNEKSDEGVLYQVPVIGGTSRKLLVNIGGPVTFSPDGKRFAFVRVGRGAESILMTANTDGTGEQKLASRRFPNNFWRLPAWSPDGKVIACAARSFSGGLRFEVVGVRVEDGVEKPITQQKGGGSGIVFLAWLSDSSGLVMTGWDQSSASAQVWLVSYPGGEAHKITNDLNSYNGMSLTADSNTFVTVQSADISNIWTAPSGDASRATQVTWGVGKYDGSEGVSWTPDGKIVFLSRSRGTNDVWIMDRDGSNPKQLIVNDNLSEGLSVSPDGRYIVFGSDRSGDLNIWRTDIDGSNPKQVTAGVGGGKFLPSFSVDGKWVVYTVLSKLGPTMWKVPIEGGDSLELSDNSARSHAVSPDGKLIAGSSFDDQLTFNRFRMAVFPFEGGPPAKLFDVWLSPFSRLRSFESLDTIRWTSDGRGLTYIDTQGGVSNIWSQPLDGSKPLQLTNFKTGRIFNFAWSRDGKWLALARGSMTSDVVLISDVR